jgi:hypothetical protein
MKNRDIFLILLLIFVMCTAGCTNVDSKTYRISTITGEPPLHTISTEVSSLLASQSASEPEPDQIPGPATYTCDESPVDYSNNSNSLNRVTNININTFKFI